MSPSFPLEENAMVITCPKCGHQGKVDESRIPPQGAKAKCPKCQSGFLIPKPGTDQTAAPPDPSFDQVRASSAPDILSPPPAPERQQPASPAREISPGFEGKGLSPAPGTGEGLSLKGPSAQTFVSKDVACTGCLKLFKEEEVARVGESVLCRSCQEAYLAKGQVSSQRSSHPIPAPSIKRPRLDYAGFWIRTGAYLVDGVLLGLIFYFILSPMFMRLASGMFGSAAFYQDPSTVDPTQMQALMAEMSRKMMRWVWISNLVSMVLAGGYFIVLEGGPGQTLGKKALGLRVVTSTGERIGYLKALARYIGKITQSGQPQEHKIGDIPVIA